MLKTNLKLVEQEDWVGVDTHLKTIACYQKGKFKEFSSSEKGFTEAVCWAGKDSKWAIEGAYCYGKPFSEFLLKNGHKVYEVNSLLTKTFRKGMDISGNKNDFGDAKVVYMIAPSFRLEEVSLNTVKIKEKITSRELAVKQTQEIINHIKGLFGTRGIILPMRNLTTKKALKFLESQDCSIVLGYAKILRELIFLTNKLEEEIKEMLPEKALKLTDLTGISFINAAIIYTELKGKLKTKAQLASYAGIAPVENSSGKKQYHKNNKGGNRILNRLFYHMSISQSRFDDVGKAYFEKKISEGKTKRHARKCLSRQLVNLVWKILNE